MSECRALTNVVGNGVATLVVSRWQGELDSAKLREVMTHPGAHATTSGRLTKVFHQRSPSVMPQTHHTSGPNERQGQTARFGLFKRYQSLVTNHGFGFTMLRRGRCVPCEQRLLPLEAP